MGERRGWLTSGNDLQRPGEHDFSLGRPNKRSFGGWTIDWGQRNKNDLLDIAGKRDRYSTDQVRNGFLEVAAHRGREARG